MCRLSNFNLLFLLLFGTFWYTLGTSRTPDQKFAKKLGKNLEKNWKKLGKKLEKKWKLYYILLVHTNTTNFTTIVRNTIPFDMGWEL